MRAQLGGDLALLTPMGPEGDVNHWNVFEDEARMLRKHRHDVRQYRCTNAEVIRAGAFKRIKAFVDAPWSKHGYHVIREELEKFKPDIMHVHNFFFILSPSIR